MTDLFFIFLKSIFLILILLVVPLFLLLCVLCVCVYILIMELAQDITSICRVRVLLIPVSPIKKSVFYKYVQLVRTFHLVRLGDVTPDLKQGSSGKNRIIIKKKTLNLTCF